MSRFAEIERRLRQWMKEDQAVNAITAIPGVGVLTATAAVATMGDAKAFRSGREFAAWIGLVPKQTGLGGKVNLLGISKRGDTYLRTLLIHGARSVLTHAKEPGPWVEQISKRRPVNVINAHDQERPNEGRRCRANSCRSVLFSYYGGILII
jgi:transposase